MLKTKLERIKEHAPQAEHEAVITMIKDMDVSSQHQVIRPGKISSPFKQVSDSSVSTPIMKMKLVNNQYDASRNQGFENEDFSYRKKSSKNVSHFAKQETNIISETSKEKQFPKTPRKLKTYKTREIPQSDLFN